MRARDLLCDTLGIAAPAPDAMIGSIASVPLQAAAAGSPAARLDSDGLCAWFRARGVRTWLYAHPAPLLRVSAQLYNRLEQFQQLARLLHEALNAG